MDTPGKTYVGSDQLYEEVQRTMRLAAEMNTGYHTEAEVRDCLRQMTGHVIPDTVRVFTPLNINYGPGVRFGHDCSCPRCIWRCRPGSPDLRASDSAAA